MPRVGMTPMWVRNQSSPIKFGFRESGLFDLIERYPRVHPDGERGAGSRRRVFLAMKEAAN